MFLAYLKAKAVVALLITAWTGGLLTGGLIWADDSAQARYLPPSHTTDDLSTRVQDLVDTYGCWRREAPSDMQGKVPGHVVVTRSDGRTVYGGAHLVGLALGQEFENQPAGLTIWAFCR